MAYKDRGRTALPFGASLTFHLYQSEEDKVADLLDPAYFKGVTGRRGFMPGDWLFAQMIDGFAIFAVRSVNLDTTVVMEPIQSPQSPVSAVKPAVPKKEP